MKINDHQHAAETLVILVGATGHLGGQIARELRRRGAQVRALVRNTSNGPEIGKLKELGVLVVAVDFNNVPELSGACAGGSVLVSALSGLREVVVETQSRLLEAAVAAGVPRFIPSDYAIDFNKLPAGTNRNLDLRREFAERLNKAPLAATSILNGMFTNLLTGQAPVVLFPVNRVLYWGKAEQLLDFTTLENTAAFTAAAALDPTTPRYLRIAGEVINAYDLREAASQATGKEFKLFRAGGLGRLQKLIDFTKLVFPQKKEVFPAWQGMQYLRDMFSGLPKLNPLDNDRYPDIHWTSVQEVLASGN